MSPDDRARYRAHWTAELAAAQVAHAAAGAALQAARKAQSDAAKVHDATRRRAETARVNLWRAPDSPDTTPDPSAPLPSPVPDHEQPADALPSA
jgi:hypothetical protein